MSIDRSTMNNPLPNTTNSMNGDEEEEDEEENKPEVVAYGKWYEMMRISGHSTPGLLMCTLNNDSSAGACFMYLTESGEIQISDFSHKFKNYYWSGCNGFMLKCCPDSLLITNPATNQQLHLPPFIDPTQWSFTRSAIAYVATRMEYKVIRTYKPPHNLPCFKPRTLRINCAILTVGIDNSWRLVDTQHLSLENCQQLQLCPLVTEGFAHWIQDKYPISNGFVLTLNMETETMTRYVVPRCDDGPYLYYKYIATGDSCLSLLIARGHFQFNVWEMNSETGVWSKLFNIDLGAHQALFDESYDREEEDWLKLEEFGCRLYPAGWLKYPEVVVFALDMLTRTSFLITTSRVVYNVQTQDITVLRSDYETTPPYLFHKDNQLIIHGMQDQLPI